MLEDYKEKQPLFYNQVSKIIKSDKISHAYLIETNDCPYGFDIAIYTFLSTLGLFFIGSVYSTNNRFLSFARYVSSA